MAARILQPLTTLRPIVDNNGAMNQESRFWFQMITERSLIIGTGSPEGVIEASQGSEFMDDAGIAGAIKYIKRDSQDITGDQSKGWVLV